ncbi:GNAT family N-acetyltransferase [Aurantibacter sp.]|uniref:GNAT family N-acetyltransferase n=1 Tax=Aurantibacter sp. TaxID=2807103 RepID=UPI0035C7D86E
MVTLKTETCYLRALEPEDLDFIYQIENDETVWEVSQTITPYSRFLIKEYLENAHKDIFEVKQQRFVICKLNNETVGLIDVYDFDIKNKRAGVGILIYGEENKAKGYGTNALKMVVDYCFKHLDLHQLHCNVTADNLASIKLFETQKFEKIGLKKDWVYTNGTYKDEYIYQLINYVH